jgi:hypothetical protein
MDPRTSWAITLLPPLALLPLGACPEPECDGADCADDDSAGGGDDDDASGQGDWGRTLLDPDRLAVYLGPPALLDDVSGDTSAANAAARLADYEIVVLQENGDLLEDSHPDWVELAGLLQAGGAQVFGWLEAGAPRAGVEIDGVLDVYEAAGLDGVCLTGLDLPPVNEGNNEARPIFFANNARDLGMSVMLHAEDPADVVQSLEGVGESLHPGDRILIGGFTTAGGDWEAEASWRARVEAATAGAAQYGATVVALAQGEFAAERWSYAFHAAWLDGLEAVGWAADDLGAAGETQLSPDYPGPFDPGTEWTSAVSSSGSVYTRTSNAGTLTVDAAQHVAQFE